MQRVLPSLRLSVLSTRALSTAAARGAVRVPVQRAVPVPSTALYRASPSSSSFSYQTRLLQTSKKGGDANYAEIKAMSQQPTEDSLLIDVREPDEVMMGSIPSSVNVPLSNLEKAFDMDDSDFMRAYGFRKPAKKASMIFFCKAGIRSSSATSLAKGKGFTNARNYPGSYADWQSHEQKSDSD